jgi:hypothetical protein
MTEEIVEIITEDMKKQIENELRKNEKVKEYRNKTKLQMKKISTG